MRSETIKLLWELFSMPLICAGIFLFACAMLSLWVDYKMIKGDD